MRYLRWSFLTTLLVLSMLLAACGGGAEEPAAEEPAAEEPAAEEPAAEEPAAEEPAADDSGAAALPTPPEVFNADVASDYSGAQITYYGDAVGLGSDMDQALAGAFADATGIEVEIIPRPQDATETYATYQRFFQAQSGEVDVMMIDVIWPGAFAPHLVDLSEPFADTIDLYYEGIVENNTIDDRLVGIPWFADFGMLYYRTDLLEEYGYDGPPETWDEMEEIAAAVQAGEREAGNDTFAGFVWQGAAYEGLTCNVLEWVYSHGGGTFIEGGEVTFNNPQAIEALDRAAGWVGTISPEGVVSYQEEDARNVFQGGNAMFMRNWPYAYSVGNSEDSPVQGVFDVAPLPNNGGDTESVGTVGGWQLGVSSYSENPEAAIEFVRYMASAEAQQWRAVVGSFVPTMPDVTQDEAVLEAMPFLANLEDVLRVTRPSAETGERYNEASTVIFQTSNQVLLGSENAENALAPIENRLSRLTR